ncbi:hypothetical protein PVAP13_5KG381700 [Panicum virgatum]|uniref:Uncharacterized protein n=1 Tax=Panicum virgatum TaxID=38727 RepID=A0A8T0SME5_PANVG|nr:hypothetical protein PVAP13_5KG381700 [Panicum virgatum]
MENLLHGMLGFFPIGDAICSESDMVKLLVFQGASGGFGSSGLSESFFFLQDGDVEISCGFPMRGVGFLVQKEEEDGGSTVWSMMKMIGEQYWLLGSFVFPYVLAEGGLDSPLLGLSSELVTSSAAADSVRSSDFVGASGSFLFQDFDGDGRCALGGRRFAAKSWRSLSISWTSSSLSRRVSSSI